MQGASACHACGRCSGQRGAVALSLRSPNVEIIHVERHGGSHWDATLLLFGVIGLAMGAFQWTVSPWFISLKQAAAEWLVERELLRPLEADAPWWLLTHYPQVNDAFTWLDGGMIVVYLFAASLLLGAALWLLTTLAARLGAVAQRQLALCLIPLGAAGLFLGLSATTVKLLRYEGLSLDWVGPGRMALLGAAIAWSLWLGWRALRMGHAGLVRQTSALVCLGLGGLLVGYGWWLQFWGWN
jgi:hypothetical protein